MTRQEQVEQIAALLERADQQYAKIGNRQAKERWGITAGDWRAKEHREWVALADLAYDVGLRLSAGPGLPHMLPCVNCGTPCCTIEDCLEDGHGDSCELSVLYGWVCSESCWEKIAGYKGRL